MSDYTFRATLRKETISAEQMEQELAQLRAELEAAWPIKPCASPEAEQAARQAVFDKIRPAPDWRAPIDAWVDAGDFAECNKAAIWFTGAPLRVVGKEAGKLRVTAPGYWATMSDEPGSRRGVA